MIHLARPGDFDYFLDQMELMPVKQPAQFISEYVEGKRVLPSNTPRPGPWENSYTPYLIEPMNNASPYSGITQTWVKKGAQLGFTAGAENIVGYWMDESPGEILFITATEAALEKWATKRLEPVIDSLGFRHKIFAQNLHNAKSRRTGDKTFQKQYPGGNLDMASAQSASSLRSDSKRVLIFDEVDGAPQDLRTGEGNYVEVGEARTNAWGNRKKEWGISTPTLAGHSMIDNLYNRGDKRFYLVPCPYCGKDQVLELSEESTNHGLKADTKAGKVVSVYYLCDHCHDAIFNHHKGAMLQGGHWEPTAVPDAPDIRSYQISSLYSPVGMLSWREYWAKYQKALDTPDGMRSFTNLYGGEAYRETGARPKLETVIELKGAYKRGTVPQGVIYVTMAIDVQRGSKAKDNPARLEMEIVGHGLGYRTWSIDYKVFNGAIDDANEGAWLKLTEWARKTGLRFAREDGVMFSPQIILADSGDGKNTHTVYEFCQQWNNTFPCKGFDKIKRRKYEKKNEGIDEAGGQQTFKKFRATKINEETTLIAVSTNHYKHLIYTNLKKTRNDGERQTPGFCDFPSNYKEKYFKGLTAEEKRADGSFYCPTGRANEPLDVRVYNLCAADVWLETQVTKLRAAYKEQGAKPEQLLQINSRVVLEKLAANLSK